MTSLTLLLARPSHPSCLSRHRECTGISNVSLLLPSHDYTTIKWCLDCRFVNSKCYKSLSTHQHALLNVFSLAEHFLQLFGSQNCPQRRLSQEQRWVVGVLNLANTRDPYRAASHLCCFIWLYSNSYWHDVQRLYSRISFLQYLPVVMC